MIKGIKQIEETIKQEVFCDICKKSLGNLYSETLRTREGLTISGNYKFKSLRLDICDDCTEKFILYIQKEFNCNFEEDEFSDDIYDY